MDQKFSGRLKEERSRLRLTQAALANATGVSPGSQVSYEAGRRTPDLNYLARLEQMSIDVHYVITGRRLNEVMQDRFDWRSHDNILQAIEVWLEGEGLVLPFAKKMDLLRLFMHSYADREVVDLEHISRTLRLVA